MPSIYRVDPSDVETFTVVTNPIRTYTSSSVHGATGSVYLFARRSHIQKDLNPDSSFVETAHDDSHIAETLRQAQFAGRTARSSTAMQSVFARIIRSYLDKVSATAVSRRTQQTLDVNRFTPPFDFNSNTLRKLVVKDMLQTYYRTSYPTAHWAFSNYNSLNFFTASTVPSDSVLLYPNIDSDGGGLVHNAGHFSGSYTPSGSFSFDFYINPRYQQDQPNVDFKPGTILHLSSTFALSLISGSSKDVTGRAQCYRLQLQLSHSADIPPSQLKVNGNTVSFVSGGVSTGSLRGFAPLDLVFLSDDNALQFNHWHHVVVRWGTKDINNGTGSFNIDGVDRGTFVIPSSSITPRSFSTTSTQGEASVLCMGNFYEGKNNGVNLMANFFATDPARRDGLNELIAQTSIEEPASYAFRHPLNAELHDVAIRRCYMSDHDINVSASMGPTFLDNTFAFYVPPFFVTESPYRQFVGDHGGILVTPFEEVDGSTTAPFSVALSFGVGGHYINLENYVRDFAGNVFPRLHHLTGVAIQTSTDAVTCNEFLYRQPFVVKRNLSILPCDDGLFVPQFQLLASETLTRAVDDLGIEELSFVNLDDMVHTASLLFGGSAFDDGAQDVADVNAFADLQIGNTPETPFASAGPALRNYTRNVVSGSDVEAGAPLTIFQRTQDGSSNQVTFFDISNMFYGFKMKPGSLQLSDSSLSGSNGAVKITLADDGRGNVYRADCLTSASTWNSVGNIYYDEGIVVLKNPHVFFFGKDQYELNFRGEQHVHVMKVDAFAPNNQLNSSSNPSFMSVPPNGYPNDPEDDFVYITGLNFHDKDLNVVMKTTLAQPIMKRSGDKLLFKVKFDW